MALKVHVRGDRVRRLREGQKFTQGQLSLRSGVDRSLISRIERGIRPNVYVETIGALARALNTTSDYLLGLTANPFPSHQSTDPPTELEYRLSKRLRQLSEEEQRYTLALLDFIDQYGQPPPPRIIGNEAKQEEKQAS